MYNNRVVFQKYIVREDLRNNPNVIYLFSDNLQRIGFDGQSKEMRGEPNSIGIVTKKTQTEYFSDNEYDKNIVLIEQDIKRIPKNRLIVIPSEGIGLGVDKMIDYSPKTYNFLKIKIEGIIND